MSPTMGPPGGPRSPSTSDNLDGEGFYNPGDYYIRSYDREDDNSDDGDTEDVFELPLSATNPYRDPFKGGLYPLNLVVEGDEDDDYGLEGYVPTWKARHGWRELYQNWVDAIKESNNMKEQSFQITPRHCKNFPCWIALHPNTKDILGFIRFSKKSNTVELTNYKAWLSGKTLGLGSTTKRFQEHLAGHHGEGYKLAGLVLLRKGYSVKIKASGCTWTFKVPAPGEEHEGQVCVKVVRMTPKVLQKRKDAFESRKSRGFARTMKGNIWEDVTFEIGSGDLVLTEEDVLSWTKDSLELELTASSINTELRILINTEHGSLLLDPNFRNKVFLKGIRVDHATFSDGEFQFGYNLARGEVDRDRYCLSDSHEQGELLARIWAKALEIDSSLVEQYVKMLQQQPTPPDVFLAEHHITEETAKKIWQHLLDKDPEHEQFYYDCNRGDQDVELITNSLKKTPVQLQKGIWMPLMAHCLVRTPQEQQVHLFHNAPEAADSGSQYSATVKQALMAALALDLRTKDFKLVFKPGDKVELDLLLDGNTLQINEKWLEFQASHETTPCQLSRLATMKESVPDYFSCDHIVADLYKLVLEELERNNRFKASKELESKSSLIQRVLENLRQMLLMVKSKLGDEAGEIEVSWMDLEGDLLSRVYQLDPKCRVTMHRESTCSAKRSVLLCQAGHLNNMSTVDSNVPTTEEHHSHSKCDCPEVVVSQKDFKARFIRLSRTEEYFPIVSRVDLGSFIGLAPASLRPEFIASWSPESSFHAANISIEGARSPSPKEEDVFDDYEHPNLYDSDTESGKNGSETDMRNDEKMGIDTHVGNMSHRTSLNGSVVGTIPTSSTSSTTGLEGRASDRSQSGDAKIKLGQLINRNRSPQAQADPDDSNPLLQAFRNEVLQFTDDDVKRIQANLAAEETQLQAKENQIRQAHSRIQVQQQRIVDLEAQLFQSQTEIKAQHQQIIATEEQLQDSNSMQIPNDLAIEVNRIRTVQLKDAEAQVSILQRELTSSEESNETKQKQLVELQVANENMKSRDQDANLVIEGLRTQLQRLRGEMAALKTQLASAEDAYDQQLRLASETVARRRGVVSSGIKREINEGGNHGGAGSERGSKRARTVVKDEKVDVVDLTGGD